MADKTREHIAEQIIDESPHPLEQHIYTANSEVGGYIYYGSTENHPTDIIDRDLRYEYENQKDRQWEAIRDITQFVIDHEGLCYRCALRDEKDVQDVIEEEHPLDAIVKDIDDYRSTAIMATGTVNNRVSTWIQTIANYVKEKM